MQMKLLQHIAQIQVMEERRRHKSAFKALEFMT
jgi:hypothetical protein